MIKNCLVIDALKISDEIIVTNDLVELINDHQFILWEELIMLIAAELIPEQIEEKLSHGIIPVL
jgi:O-succinylbenzoic acid--CoA ligase